MVLTSSFYGPQHVQGMFYDPRVKFGWTQESQNTGLYQKEWTSITKEGHFDSLEWIIPNNDINDSGLKKMSNFIPNIIGTNT